MISPKDALELAKDYQSHSELAHNEPNLLILSDALISAHEKLDELGSEFAIVCHFKEKLEKATTALKFYEEACYISRGHMCEQGINHVIDDKGIRASEALKEIENG